MKNHDANKEPQNPMTAELEARIVAWVAGEASATEAAELAALAAASPQAEAFRRGIEAALGLAAEAVSADREPMALSAERRAVVRRTFERAEARRVEDLSGVPTLTSIPTLMRRMNLAFAAVFTVVLIAGVTWWGERTHYRPPGPAIADPVAKPDFIVIKPDEPVPVEEAQPQPKKRVEEPAPPNQPDYPAKQRLDDFIQPIEPPRPNVDFTITRISTPGDGPGEQLYRLSDLDEPPITRYQARPVYPTSLRQAGISGEAIVDFIVDTNGQVRNAVAIRSSQREFEESACAAVSKWRFKPGRKGGHPVYVHMQVPIVFSLSQDGTP